MLKMQPTKNLIGITIQGDYNDFYELVESIYRLTGFDEDESYLYYGVQNRLLGICYDIRHAFMGDRDIQLEDNGMNQDIMDWHKMITPTQNVYYSVEVLFPEALFAATAVPQMFYYSSRYYGSKSKKNEESEFAPRQQLYAEYVRDKAYLSLFFAGIWQALGEVIGDEELEKLIRILERQDEFYSSYATHYIDKCNIELITAPVEKRKDKLRNIAKRILKKPAAYYKLEESLRYWAKQYGTSIYELEDPRIKYPEDWEW